MEKSALVQREEEVLAFWKDEEIFQKSLKKPSPKGEFVFYDGPPFATGLPHMGHLLGSTIKDLVGRYKTMRGYHVDRRWGWDTHGLPIESLVEKELGLKTKKDILSVGIDTFNETARALVLKYVDEWERYIDRVGRWVDYRNSYKTMDNSYIESVWWAIKQLDSKKLLYEGRKVLMYCTHCETPLAKAEIAMDNTYRDITEEAVTVKFKVTDPHKYNLPENTFILAWTTTPWTLPGNVALAVGPAITYGVMQKDGEHYILAEDGGELTGSSLVGIEYEPLFDVPALRSNTSYKVYAADFVTTGEGTGIVHTAVMYGEDDFALGQREKLPMVQLLEANGHYNAQAPEFIRGEFYKKAEKSVKEDLERRGLLFSREMHTHSYPHCYRCGSPLIYNAVVSWFINIQKVKAKLLSENEKITWVPEHLKHGRFRNIVENAPDWTISRNRFWASPLPIWKEKGGSGMLVVGSLKELIEKTKRSGNNYFVMRHGEAQSNTKGIFDSARDPENHLTETGRAQVLASAKELAAQHIDLIVCSPFPRTHETARIVAQELGLPESALVVDERLAEINVGDYNGKPTMQWVAQFHSLEESFTKRLPNSENFSDLRARVGELLFELDRTHSGKRILIVTHGAPARMLSVLTEYAQGVSVFSLAKKALVFKTAQWKEFQFTPYPHNAKFELDLHRPYIDNITLSVGSKEYERIPEVIDCWVESGAMPFAAAGYPRNRSRVDPKNFFGLSPKGYPGDFIAEYIAQTRTWFYYMHAMGILLFNSLSFRSVVSTGTILAADGSKMSKSKGNYTDPYELMDQFGADALRLHFMGSVVMQGEDLNFRESDVREAHNRVLGILWNSYNFFELYKKDYLGDVRPEQSGNVLDRWILSLLSRFINEMTEALDAYDTPRAARSLRAFVEDYSTWYLRRSRARVREESKDKQYALSVQRHVLMTLAKLSAPIIPFMAESVYRGVDGDKQSVHLSEWPSAEAIDEQLLSGMVQVRELASKGLKLRENEGIKLRQPLQTLKAHALPADQALRTILAEELNVKEVIEDASLADVWIDTNITPQLREEGVVRDLIRRIQEWRKEKALTIADRPNYHFEGSAEEKTVAQKYRDEIISATGLGSFSIDA